MNISLNKTNIPSPYSEDLNSLNFSDGRLFETDIWQQYFKRLREEDPVHYQKDSPFGPFWSVTRYEDIYHSKCSLAWTHLAMTNNDLLFNL